MIHNHQKNIIISTPCIIPIGVTFEQFLGCCFGQFLGYCFGGMAHINKVIKQIK